MANSITIAGYAYLELVDAFNDGLFPITGTFYTTNEFGMPPAEGVPEYEEMLISAPGIDGCAKKRIGFRGRMIHARLAFIGATKADCENEKTTFFENVTTNDTFSVQVPGGTLRPSCMLVPGSGRDGTWTYMGGMMVLLVDFQFRQIRLT